MKWQSNLQYIGDEPELIRFRIFLPFLTKTTEIMLAGAENQFIASAFFCDRRHDRADLKLAKVEIT
jgi:hypothetical protein